MERSEVLLFQRLEWVIFKNMNQPIIESSISRIHDHLKNHDCGFITAWRSATDCNQGVPFTREQKNERNRKLFALLKTKGFGVTKVKGSYIEDFQTPAAKEVGEESFFVVDINDSGNLKETLINLGEAFEQDSILFSAQGGENIELIGTSDCENAYPGKGNTIPQGSITGEESQFFSRIGSRAFSFHEIAEPGVYGKAARAQMAKIYAKELGLKGY